MEPVSTLLEPYLEIDTAKDAEYVYDILREFILSWNREIVKPECDLDIFLSIGLRKGLFSPDGLFFDLKLDPRE